MCSLPARLSRDYHVRRSCWGALVLVLSLVGQQAQAQAQEDDPLSRARQLYNQGLTQEAAGDWAGALATFQQVGAIRMTPQVRFHIARSKEHLGRLNEALGGYRMAEYDARRAASDSTELLSEIDKARKALLERIPKLTIERGQGAKTLRIELDGVVLGQSQIGTEISVDPGPHLVVGIVPGGRRIERSVELAEAQVETVVLDVPAALRETPAPSSPAPPKPERVGPRMPDAASGVSPGWIVVGAGVASLAASGVFFLLKQDAEKDLEAGCLGRTCPDTLEDTQKRGETYATLSGVTLGLGVVGVGVGTVMLLSGGAGPDNKRPVSLGFGAGSVQLGGWF